ncbi:MAG: carbohydrate ABC transporter permease [Clostridia bacterium]|nr:carbohydrate ABC transporter permease [Clostridia bacterium]
MLNVKRKRRMDETASILTHKSGKEKILYIIISVLFGLYALTIVYPLLFMIINSFQFYLEYNSATNPFALPSSWHFENYITAISKMNMVDSSGREIGLVEMFFNSIWFCFVTIFGGVFCSACTGYCLSKYNFKLRNAMYTIAIFSMTIPIVGNTGAMFKLTSDLGIYNSPLYVILSSLGGFGFNFLVMYGFFSNVSWSYAEAAFIDGASQLKVFFQIMLPQAFMSILTLSIVAFIRVWNDYMTPLLYLPDYPTVASGLYIIEQSFTRSGDYPSYFAGLVLSTIPVIIVFASCSDVIMKNFSVGGLKG